MTVFLKPTSWEEALENILKGLDEQKADWHKHGGPDEAPNWLDERDESLQQLRKMARKADQFEELSKVLSHPMERAITIFDLMETNNDN